MRVVALALILVSLCCGTTAYADTGEDGEGPAITKSAEAMLVARDFAGLERAATKYRRENTKLTGGNAALYHFYPGLGGSCEPCTRSSISSDQRFDLLTEWTQRNPKSVTARLAVAAFWYEKAWEGRGTGYANTVSEERWRIFRECLRRAKASLDGIDPSVDPEVYYLLLGIASGQSAPRAEIDSLYRKAIAAHPDYYHYYTQHAEALEEKWHGKPGEFLGYLSSLLHEPGGEVGFIAYSYAAVNLLTSSDCNPNDIFHSVGLQWQPIKNGLEIRLKKYGLRNHDWNAYAYLAALSGNSTEGQIAFDKVGESWDPSIWKAKETFSGAREWVRTANSQK